MTVTVRTGLALLVAGLLAVCLLWWMPEFPLDCRYFWGDPFCWFWA